MLRAIAGLTEMSGSTERIKFGTTARTTSGMTGSSLAVHQAQVGAREVCR